MILSKFVMKLIIVKFDRLVEKFWLKIINVLSLLYYNVLLYNIKVNVIWNDVLFNLFYFEFSCIEDSFNENL